MQYIYFKDPLYGFVEIPIVLKNIVDSAELQRLRRIKQLCGAEYVYPGANHTRFEHSLGTFHLASKLINQLQKNQEAEISAEEVLEIQAAALLHDIGHGPFSHTFEEILQHLFRKNHEDITDFLINYSEISVQLENIGLNPQKIALLATGRYNHEKKYFLDQIICSAIDCDSLDYLIRDSYHCGAQFGTIDVQRIILQTGVLENFNLGFNVKCLPNLESYLLSRLNSYRTIYFHKTSRGVQLLLVKAMMENLSQLEINPLSPETYLQWDDYSMWQFLKCQEKSKKLIDNIQRRVLPKVIFEKHKFSEDKMMINKSNEIEDLLSEIAQRIHISVDELLIDTPITPSIPYYSSINLRPNEIPIYKQNKPSFKEELSITEQSFIFSLLKDKKIQSFRIYTTRKNIESYKNFDWTFLNAYF